MSACCAKVFGVVVAQTVENHAKECLGVLIWQDEAIIGLWMWWCTVVVLVVVAMRTANKNQAWLDANMDLNVARVGGSWRCCTRSAKVWMMRKTSCSMNLYKPVSPVRPGRLGGMLRLYCSNGYSLPC